MLWVINSDSVLDSGGKDVLQWGNPILCDPENLDECTFGDFSDLVYTVNDIAWYPGNEYLFLVARNMHSLVKMRVIGDKVLWMETIWGFSNNQRAVSFSPDGRYMACGGDDEKVHLYKVLDHLASDFSQAFELIHTYDLNENDNNQSVRSIAFSQIYKGERSATLAVGSRDNKIHIYCLPGARHVFGLCASKDDYALLASLSFEDQDVNSVAFDPKGLFIAGAGNTQRLRVHLLNDLYPNIFDCWNWLDGDKNGNAVTFNPRGTILITGGTNKKVGMFRYSGGLEWKTVD